MRPKRANTDKHSPYRIALANIYIGMFAKYYEFACANILGAIILTASLCVSNKKYRCIPEILHKVA